jgi:predicted acyltransferase
MKSRITLIFLFASMAVAQVSPPSTQSRVAGRFVAYNYGLWALPAYTMPTGTGSKTFTLSSSTVRMQDGRVTVGTGGDTSGIVHFGLSWGTAPVCVAANETTAQPVRSTPSTTALTLTGTLAAADVVSWHCIGY